MDGTFVDTEIWVYSYKTPLKDNYNNEARFNADSEKHERALDFFKARSKGMMFFWTTHQLCELYQRLLCKGSKMEANVVDKIMKSIVLSRNTSIIDITMEHLKTSIELSLSSNIHVWDFICVVPLNDVIVKIYTTDRHFKHEAFKNLGVEIENPIGIWEPV